MVTKKEEARHMARTKAAVLFAIADAQKVRSLMWARTGPSEVLLTPRAAQRLGAWRSLWWM